MDFGHATGYFYEVFLANIRNLTYNPLACKKAIVLAFDCISSWSSTGVVPPNVDYYRYGDSALYRRIKRNLKDFMKTDPTNRNVRAYYLMHLGLNALKILGAAENDQDILLRMDRIRDFIDNTFDNTDVSEVESTNNLFWNSLILTGVYSLKTSPDRMLTHDWMTQIPFVSHFSSIDEDSLYPFIITISILRNYLNNIRSYATTTIITT